VEKAENRLQLSDIVGILCTGMQGLVTSNIKRWEKANVAEKRKVVEDEIRNGEEDKRRARSAEMGSQGRWTRWETTERKRTWSNIWQMEPLRMQCTNASEPT